MIEESTISSTIPSIWATMNSWFTPTILFLFLNLMIGTIFIISSLSATHKPTHHDHHHHLDHEDHKHDHYFQHPPHLVRSPSMMLQRLKSFSFYTHRSQHEPTPTTTTLAFETTQHHHQLDQPHFTNYNPPLFHDNHLSDSGIKSSQQQPPLSRSPSILQRLKSINLCNYISPEPINHVKDPQPHEDEEETLDEIYSRLQGNSKPDTNQMAAATEKPKKVPKKIMKSVSTKSGSNKEDGDDINTIELRRPATVKEGRSGNGTKTLTEMDDSEVDAKADDFINRFKQQLKLQRIDSIIRYKEMTSPTK